MHYRIGLLAILVIVVVGVAVMVWSPARTGTSGIDAIRFDTAGWRQHDVSLSSKMWKSEAGDLLQLKWVPRFPDFNPDADAESLRAEARQLASSKDGTLVSAEATTVQGRKTASLIYKRGHYPATEYVGMLFVRNGSDHFIFTLVSAERGKTSISQDDAVDHDSLAPDHPVSRIRAGLESLRKTIAFR